MEEKELSPKLKKLIRLFLIGWIIAMIMLAANFILILFFVLRI